MNTALLNIAWNGSWPLVRLFTRLWLSPLLLSSESSSATSALITPSMRCTYSHLISRSRSATKTISSLARLIQDAPELRRGRCLNNPALRPGATVIAATTSQHAATDRESTRLSANRSSASGCPTSCMTPKMCKFLSLALSRPLTPLIRWRQCLLWNASDSAIIELN